MWSHLRIFIFWPVKVLRWESLGDRFAFGNIFGNRLQQSLASRRRAKILTIILLYLVHIRVDFAGFFDLPIFALPIYRWVDRWVDFLSCERVWSIQSIQLISEKPPKCVLQINLNNFSCVNSELDPFTAVPVECDVDEDDQCYVLPRLANTTQGYILRHVIRLIRTEVVDFIL